MNQANFPHDATGRPRPGSRSRRQQYGRQPRIGAGLIDGLAFPPCRRAVWWGSGRSTAAPLFQRPTDYRQDKGPLAVGVCVEVEYVGAGEPFTATKIASKSDDNRTAGTSTPSATPSGTPSATPSATPTAPALNAKPTAPYHPCPRSGFVGLWVVNG